MATVRIGKCVSPSNKHQLLTCIELEAEMKRSKLEFRQTMDMYVLASKEALKGGNIGVKER